MQINKEAYQKIIEELQSKKVTLVAVSKSQPVAAIKALYDLGHRDFGENYVQELTDKLAQLPGDIRWHYIGHLQSNKVKYIAPFIHLIQSVDSLKLLKEINKQAEKNKRIIDVLLQVHIAQEETKFGLDEEELTRLIKQYADPEASRRQVMQMTNVRICGLMGMASFSDNMDTIRNEFRYLNTLFDKLQTTDSRLPTLSMGMSSDFKIAIEERSNMIRIGSLIFGERN